MADELIKLIACSSLVYFELERWLLCQNSVFYLHDKDLLWNVHATSEESAKESHRSDLQLTPCGQSTVSIALDEVLVLELTTFHLRACQAEVF